IREYIRLNKNKLGSVAILTPYKNQTALLKRYCGRLIGDDILTIHGSQGKEWDTVILSVCDTNDKYFTDSNNPRSGGHLILNTAVSRVRVRLVVACDVAYWSNQQGQLLCDIIMNKTEGISHKLW
ncbi:MAG: hypothetical protein LBE09_04595, partial [Christensenellaceae bacterium]|nr:hypothetical protein [Christensenellaceae bacterium]